MHTFPTERKLRYFQRI